MHEYLRILRTSQSQHPYGTDVTTKVIGVVSVERDDRIIDPNAGTHPDAWSSKQCQVLKITQLDLQVKPRWSRDRFYRNLR
jgi:hypothetical protein